MKRKLLRLSIFCAAIYAAQIQAHQPEVQELSKPHSTQDGTIRLYGAGGAHVALQKAADRFTESTGIPVKITFGPEAKWSAQAAQDADILWGTSEQAMTAFLETYHHFDSKNVQPIYMGTAVIAVPKGNPNKIKNFNDLLSKGVRLLVTEGAGVYNTSGTGVWEDVAGRTGSLDDVKNFRRNIVMFAKGSGAGFRALQAQQADAWLTWSFWTRANPSLVDEIALPKERTIYRDLNVVSHEGADSSSAQFIEFLQTRAIEEEFRVLGWHR